MKLIFRRINGYEWNVYRQIGGEPEFLCNLICRSGPVNFYFGRSVTNEVLGHLMEQVKVVQRLSKDVDEHEYTFSMWA